MNARRTEKKYRLVYRKKKQISKNISMALKLFEFLKQTMIDTFSIKFIKFRTRSFSWPLNFCCSGEAFDFLLTKELDET